MGGWTTAQLVGHRPFAELKSPFLGSSPRRTLTAAFEALLPDPTYASGCTESVDQFLATGDPVVGHQLALGLRVLEHWSGVSRFTRFSRMDIAQRQQVLDAWCSSGFGLQRQIANAVRKVVLFTWYADERSWAVIGYDGPQVNR